MAIGPPLFTQEGPAYYEAAFAYMEEWAIPGPYQESLTDAEERDFRAWVASKNVPFNVNAGTVDYDMRGFWKHEPVIAADWHEGQHFPDTYKTPYDTSFSDESKYAIIGSPLEWEGDLLVNQYTDQIVFGPPGAGAQKTTAKKTPSTEIKPTAREKLERSKLKTTQLEGLGDVNLSHLVFRLKDSQGIDVIDFVTDIVIERTIEGASTLHVKLNDDDREILRSGRLSQATDVKIDGLWFRLAQVNKNGSDLECLFEDREIAVLRTYAKFKQANRTKVTRAEFILNLIREVKEFKIPVVMPELHTVMPVEQPKDKNRWSDKTGSTSGSSGDYFRTRGLPRSAQNNTAKRPGNVPEGTGPKRSDSPTGADLLVDGNPPTDAQLDIAEMILDVGMVMKVNRKLLVCAIMTAITETHLTNPDEANSDGDSCGVFQQRPSWGSTLDRMNPATSARLFYNAAIRVFNGDPHMPYGPLCQAVQHSRFPERYALHRVEAERFATVYGVPGTDNEIPLSESNTQNVDIGGLGGQYLFYRGEPDDTGTGKWLPENSWRCIQRLADEVSVRAFFVSGVFYWISDDTLMKSRPQMTIDEQTTGIDTIDFDYDRGKKSATVTVKCRASRWTAPPGSVVQLVDMGPVNGRWLVNRISRSLFTTEAEITLKKPRPILPEPAESNDPSTKQWDTYVPEDEGTNPKQYQTATALVQPSVKGHDYLINGTNHGGQHATSGLAGYEAYDWWIHAGEPIVAPENGRITRFSGHDPASGLPEGPHGPFAWSLYMHGESGTDYFITHMGARAVIEGQTVTAGTKLGTAADFEGATAGATPDHAHIGLSGGAVTLSMLAAAPQVEG